MPSTTPHVARLTLGTSRAGGRIAAVLLAAVCVSVLGFRVHLGFERVRIRAVTTPITAASGSVSVPLPDLRRLADAPAALVLRLKGTDDDIPLVIAMDATEIARINVPARQEIRADASFHPVKGRGHHLALRSERRNWQLAYVEIANVHGFSSGLFSFVLLPRDRRASGATPWWLLPAAFAFLLWLRPVAGRPRRTGVRGLHSLAAALVLGIFVAALIVDRVTPYKLLLALHTYVLGVAILYADRVAPLASTAWPLMRSWAAQRTAVREITARVLARPHLPTTFAATLAIAVAAAAVTFGSHIAGGADSYGYVSQAAMWARGEAKIDQSLLAALPPGTPDTVTAPLGYVPHRPSGVPDRIVPIYAPGLPMVMTVFRWIGGPGAVFVVAPMMAGVAVWLTFLLGRRMHTPATGVLAAVLLASSPAFLVSMLNPMSDVPVTAWWLLAFVAVSRASPRAAALAGTATSLAILTRPNLAPLGALIALPLLWRAFAERTRARVTELGIFSAAASVGPFLTAVIFRYWYGSPFSSGYGTLEELFSLTHVLPNLSRYPRWVLQTTPLMLFAVFAPAVIRRRGGTGPDSAAALSCMMLAFSIALWIVYLLYVPFDNWEYLRFLLPSYPLLLVLTAVVFVAALRATPAPTLLLALLVVVVALHAARFLKATNALNVARVESRYQAAGDYAARSLPPSAMFLSWQHSGSLRYYAGRPTLRFDFLPEDRLDELAAHLEARGVALYFVLDRHEEETFRQRFAARNALGRLDWAPTAVIPGPTPVAIYDVGGRGSVSPSRR